MHIVVQRQSKPGADWGVSSLAIDDQEPGVLEIVGVLPHRARIKFEPSEAKKIIAILQKQIKLDEQGKIKTK